MFDTYQQIFIFILKVAKLNKNSLLPHVFSDALLANNTNSLSQL